jgi:acyltransferase 3
MEVRRIAYIDTAKALAIILMVVGHTSIPKALSDWIWSFHMPFFFFVSGMTTNWQRRKMLEFIRIKIQALLVPFLCYSAVNYAAFLLINNNLQIGGGNWSDFLIQILSQGWGGVALWFVPIFLLALIISKHILDYEKQWFVYGSIIICSLLGAWMDYKSVNLPWTLSTAPIACVYMLFGNRLKEIVMRITSSTIYALLAVAVGLLVTVTVSHSFRQDLAFNRILPLIPLLIASLAGTIMLLSAAMLASKFSLFSKIFGAIGRNTLEVMALSQCVIAVLNLYIPQYALLKYIMMAMIIMGVVLLKHTFNSLLKDKCVYS